MSSNSNNNDSENLKSPEDIRSEVDSLRHKDEAKTEESRDISTKSKASRMIMDFAGGVIVGLLLGYWLDKQFDSSPWLMLFCTIFGMVGGMMNMVRMSDKEN